MNSFPRPRLGCFVDGERAAIECGRVILGSVGKLLSRPTSVSDVENKLFASADRGVGRYAWTEIALSYRAIAFHVDMWHRRLAGEVTALGLLASTGERPVPHLIVNCSSVVGPLYAPL